MKTSYDLIVIGGGPAGMAAALAAHQQGIKDILIIERDKELGGILNQCIHNGFGLHHFNEELTGPEYSARVIAAVTQTNIDVLIDTMVLKIAANKTVVAVNSDNGYLEIKAKAIVLAMGCRERTRGAINICGSRPAGVYTAGTAQRLINIEGYMPGKKVVVLGSGDIGLIMARRMTLEGAKVKAVLEILPHSNGLTRNIVQCLDDYDIPLLLSHTVVKIHGNNRLEGVTFAKVDAHLKPIAATEKLIPCDTLLLSVGLIPENEISRQAAIAIDPETNGPIVDELRQTNRPGIFACGNVLKVHDLVDFVSAEGELAGIGAAQYINNKISNDRKNIKQMTCIRCPIGCTLQIEKNDSTYKVTGNKCPRGEQYAIEEMTAPKRIVTSTVKITGGLHPVISVKTAVPIPKEKISEVMKILAKIQLTAPVDIGDVVVKNIAETNVDVVTTKSPD